MAPIRFRRKPSNLPDARGTPEFLKEVGDAMRELNLTYIDIFGKTFTFQEFEAGFATLEPKWQKCLLCFAAFPDNQEVKKRALVNWWVGEDLLTSEEEANNILKHLQAKGWIVPVYKKQQYRKDVEAACSYKVNALIHAVLVLLAKKSKFLDFDDKGFLSANFKGSNRACLVKESSSFKALRMNHEDGLNPEKLETLFNVNQSYPDFFDPEWFSKVINVKVMFLGRWQNSAKHHIEMENTKFFKGGSKKMTKLKTLSLQGVSLITELPKDICLLTNLVILDLRACHNLEKLPNGIGSLKNLNYFDVSDCYLLDKMPKGVASLRQLVVLKGFVVGKSDGNSCTLSDLSGIEKLRKLTLRTYFSNFPRKKDLRAFKRLTSLEKLKIAWGGLSRLSHDGADENLETTLSNLKKMDLLGYPKKKLPSWLSPASLHQLTKLYIRGGELEDMGEVGDGEGQKWEVEILRLKFLDKLRMDWSQVETCFPKLTYLEKFNCPKLSRFPCNERGVWLKPFTTNAA